MPPARRLRDRRCQDHHRRPAQGPPRDPYRRSRSTATAAHGEPELLASAYRRSLEVASEHGLRRVAFPSISTGAYGYPIRDAARVALRTVADYLRAHDDIELVRFVLFSDRDLSIYQEAARELAQ